MWALSDIVQKEPKKCVTALLDRAGGPSWLGQAELLALKRPLSAETLLLSVNATFTTRKVLLEIFQTPYLLFFGSAAESVGLWGRFIILLAA